MRNAWNRSATPRSRRSSPASHHKELTMETKFDQPVEVSRGKKFADMTRLQKVVFVAKVVVCVGSFGFAFPNVQND